MPLIWLSKIKNKKLSTENCMKLRINAGDKNAGNVRNNAIADAYGNKFIIPLDF